jgi:NADPH-dependent 2,4-dienoyl-CoA reductase/sulfur reductase-like enzyme
MLLSNEEVIKYDQALIATGADCQRLPFILGYDATNIHILRNGEEASRIYKECEGKHLLVVGSSFIGMEVASCLVDRCKSITVIGMEKVPFERVLGKEIGALMQAYHESKGVHFVMEAIVKEFVKRDGDIAVSVTLKNGTEIPCEIIVLGAGVIPATSYIMDSPHIKKGNDKSIIVNEFLQAGESLWAVGDLARYPLDILNGALVRIEHWGMAQTQAAIAAKNMVKGPTTSISKKVPFFWTVQYGKNVKYCGHTPQWNEIVFDQMNDDVKSKDFGFLAYYVLDDKVVAVCSLNRDPLIAQIAELMNAGKIIFGPDLKQAISRDNNSIQFIKNLLV